MNQHVQLSTVFKDGNDSDKPHVKRKQRKEKSDEKDRRPDGKGSELHISAYDYACETLTLGLLTFDFKDAVREGDGDRMLSIWKYPFLLFKATGKKNYAIESFTLLAQYNILLPPSIGEQLKWSRFINVHGLPGKNVSCDLHMEHLNRLVKTAMDGLGANKTEKAISRASKAIGVLSKIMESYDQKMSVCETTGIHRDVSFTTDAKKIVDQLIECDAFNPSTVTKHASFTFKKNLIKTLDEKKVKHWMTEQFSKLLNPEVPELNELVVSDDGE